MPGPQRPNPLQFPLTPENVDGLDATIEDIYQELRKVGGAATVDVGTTTTGAAGTDAEVTNSGTDRAAVFNFTIPRGDTGATGPPGPTADLVYTSIYRATDFTVTHNAAAAPISFSDEVLDTDDAWVIGSPTRITVPETGMYVIHGHVNWTSLANGFFELSIYKNGALVLMEPQADFGSALGFYYGGGSLTALVHANANDYFELYARWVAGVGTADATITGGQTTCLFQINNLVAGTGTIESGGGSGSGSESTPHGVFSRRWCAVMCWPANQAEGVANLPAIAVGGTRADGSTTLNAFCSYSTAASGTSLGIRPNTGLGLWQTRHNPKFSVRFRTGPSIANIRIIIGFDTGQPIADTVTRHFVAFRYSTSVPDPGWVGICNNNTVGGTQVSAQIAAIAVDTDYELVLEIADGGARAIFTINDGTPVEMATNLPTTTTGMNWWVNAVNLAAEAKSIKIAAVHLDWD